MKKKILKIHSDNGKAVVYLDISQFSYFGAGAWIYSDEIKMKIKLFYQ